MARETQRGLGIIREIVSLGEKKSLGISYESRSSRRLPSFGK
jgi:hypothetical protein